MKTVGLARKFSIGIALLVVCTLGAVTVLTIINGQSSLRRQVSFQNLSEATLVSRAIEQYVVDASRIMREAATRPKLAFEIRHANWVEARKVLVNIQDHFKQFDYLFIQDPKGFITARVPHAETVGQDFSFRDFFQQAIKTRQPFVSGVYVSKATKRSVISIAVPVTESGAVRGVLVGALSLNKLSEFISRIGRHDGSVLYVVDEKGFLIAHSEGRGTTLLENLRENKIVQEVLAGKTGTMEFADPAQDENLLDAYVPIKRLGWGVVAEQPISIAFAPVAKLVRWIFWLAVIFTIVAVILAWTLSRFLTAPLSRLTEATKKIASGDYTARVSLQSRDEMGTLANSFNEMAEQLEITQKRLKQEIHERVLAQETTHRLNMELEQRVRERTAQLEATNKELEAFSYSVSHDLRAPLRGIYGFSEALAEDYTDKLDEQGKDYLKRVCAASERMGQLIDELLQLSRVTRSELRHEAVDLTALAKDVATELQESKPERQVEFNIAEGLATYGDQRLLQVMLQNLLGNAWKFTGRASQAKIEFGMDQPNGKPSYYVRDNGAGFDMAYADKLFHAFQRLHETSEFEGTGIGLATVQRIVHRHGGQVWAEGAVGEGATFFFTINRNGGGL